MVVGLPHSRIEKKKEVNISYVNLEREQYQNQIKDLLQAVETLLKSNNAMGERVAQLEKIAEDLKAENAMLKGELAMRKRAQHGKKSEKRV